MTLESHPVCRAAEIPIPAYWTAEEAFAVFQLLDDLHETIWAIYHQDLKDLIAKQHHPDEILDINLDELPF